MNGEQEGKKRWGTYKKPAVRAFLPQEFLELGKEKGFNSDEKLMISYCLDCTFYSLRVTLVINSCKLLEDLWNLHPRIEKNNLTD